MTRLQQVGPDRDVSPPTRALEDAALSTLLLALKTLGQRAVVALGQLTLFGMVGSVWWLFNEALPVNPSVNQLVGLGLYGLIVLLVLYIRNRS